VNVNLGGGRVVLFRKQIAIHSVIANPFSAGGDSGSLIWHWAAGVRPVGLLFFGGGGTTLQTRLAPCSPLCIYGCFHHHGLACLAWLDSYWLSFRCSCT
jgi:hypothetical protein